MRLAGLAILAISLAGCEHLYGGVDMGRFAGPLTPDLERRIIDRATAATGRRNGLADGEVAAVSDCGVNWCVRFGQIRAFSTGAPT